MKYRLAGRVVEMDALFGDTLSEMSAYLYEGNEKPEQVFRVTKEEFEREKEAWVREFASEIEDRILSQKFYKWLLGHDATYIHSCAIELDGWGYVFTADSGTGKSTHSRMWAQRFGGDVRILNDDKAFIRVAGDGRAFACGSPWHGKVEANINAEAPLAGICLLRQGKENIIERVPEGEAAAALLPQIYIPDEEESLDKALGLLDRIVAFAPVYRLCCTISEQAAELAYKTMCPEVKRL